ncbi:protease modulator HflK N-terminal domain-containing protein, partial [Psychromonas aquatilis]
DDKNDQDPWNKNNKNNDQGPPDLDVIFKKISGF